MVKLLFLHMLNAKEQVSDHKCNWTQRKSAFCVVHHQSLRLTGLALICADLADLRFGLVPSWSSGWYQDLWELEASSREEGASALGKGTGIGPFSSVGNYSGTIQIRGGKQQILNPTDQFSLENPKSFQPDFFICHKHFCTQDKK